MAEYLDKTGLKYFWGKIKAKIPGPLQAYPVGSIYMSISSNFNPNTSFGGTWSKIAEGQCLIQAGNTYALGGSYGSNSHAITESEMPAHNHKYSNNLWVQSTGYGSVTSNRSTGANRADIANPTSTTKGGGQAMSLMQASLAVNIWKRTA